MRGGGGSAAGNRIIGTEGCSAGVFPTPCLCVSACRRKKAVSQHKSCQLSLWHLGDSVQHVGASEGKAAVCSRTPMAEVLGSFGALRCRSAAPEHLGGVPRAAASLIFLLLLILFSFECLQKMGETPGRESWDFPVSWQEAFQSIPALLRMPGRAGHVFFFSFPLSI